MSNQVLDNRSPKTLLLHYPTFNSRSLHCLEEDATELKNIERQSLASLIV